MVSEPDGFRRPAADWRRWRLPLSICPRAAVMRVSRAGKTLPSNRLSYEPVMRLDRRPYPVKKAYLAFRRWYTNYFVKPHFDHLGDYHTFMKPWYTQVSGPNIRMGKCATVVS